MSVLSEQKKKSLLVFAAVIVCVLLSTFVAVHFLNSDSEKSGNSSATATPIPDPKPAATANSNFNKKILLNQPGKSTNIQNETNTTTTNTEIQSSDDEDPVNGTPNLNLNRRTTGTNGNGGNGNKPNSNQSGGNGGDNTLNTNGNGGNGNKPNSNQSGGNDGDNTLNTTGNGGDNTLNTAGNGERDGKNDNTANSGSRFSYENATTSNEIGGNAPKTRFAIGKFNSDILFKAQDNDAIEFSVNNIEQPGFIEFLQTPEFRKDGFVGIVNMGNSCYAGVILQMLFRIPKMRTFISNLQAYSPYIGSQIDAIYMLCKSGVFEESMLNYEDRISAAEFMIGINHIFYQLQNNPKRKPANFKYKMSMKCMPGAFARNGQFDMNDYYDKFFEMILPFIPSSQQSFFFPKIFKQEMENGKMVVEKYYLNRLSLEIPEVDATLENALKLYINDVSKSITREILSLPEILPIQLIRTDEYNENGGKILTAVEMPLEYDFVKFYNPENESTKFRLKMFARHLGDLSGNGHFIAYSREAKGQWIKMDDHKVSIADEEVEEALKISYYFFYERIPLS